MEMKAGLTFACMNLKKLAKILEKRGWNTAGFLAFLRKIKKELIISEKWCWAKDPTPSLSTVCKFISYNL